MGMPGRLPERGGERHVRRLLEYLAGTGCDGGTTWEGWRITRIAGGRNNLVYRARGSGGDLAIKFAVPDECDRAGREYGALTVLRQAGLSVAPEPVLLDRGSYAQPVVVQSWLDGEVNDEPPATTAEWHRLLEHLAFVHTVTPDKTSLNLKKSRLHASSAMEAKEVVQRQVARIPERRQDPGLQALLERLQAAQFPDWPVPPVALCRLDNNITNYVRRPGLWASVDWEYSGWGDPAFDVANLLTHVAYMEVPTSRWEAFAAVYCSLVPDATAFLRIQAYCQILLVWWVARLACYLYELPRGLDRRLADWPAGWQEDIGARYRYYLQLAGMSVGPQAMPWDTGKLARRPAWTRGGD
jgi:thiamine kinase-like enzyme